MSNENNIIMPTRQMTDQHDMLYPILLSVFEEFRELSKKKQDGALNETKVKMTNRILREVKELLKDDPAIRFLDLLDEETMQTNSDAVMIVAQFKAAMDQFKSKYFGIEDGHRKWLTKAKK
jgi:hypothetical protein